MSGTSSTPSTIGCGLPQGSVLGPILFVLYSADLLLLIECHQLKPHAFADDTHIYGFCRPSDVELLSDRVSVCIDEVSLWMKANGLQLNHAKTEVICLSSVLSTAPTSDPINSGSHRQHIKSTSSVRAGPRRISQHRRQPDDPRHRSCQVVLGITTTNPKCVALAATARSTDAHSG